MQGLGAGENEGGRPVRLYFSFLRCLDRGGFGTSTSLVPGGCETLGEMLWTGGGGLGLGGRRIFGCMTVQRWNG